jgi:hypothetical protein
MVSEIQRKGVEQRRAIAISRGRTAPMIFVEPLRFFPKVYSETTDESPSGAATAASALQRTSSFDAQASGSSLTI